LQMKCIVKSRGPFLPCRERRHPWGPAARRQGRSRAMLRARMVCCGLPQLWERRPGGALGLTIELKERRRAGAKNKRRQVAALQNRFMGRDDLQNGRELGP
jgi:hypothetical protein